MILEFLLFPIFLVIGGIINFIPTFDTGAGAGVGISALIEIIGVVFYVFPASLFFYIIGTAMMWQGVHMGMSIFDWVYRKIPFI